MFSGFWVRQAEASLAHIEGREAVLSVQLAGAAERARSAEARMARLQGEQAARQSTLAQCEDEAAQMGQVHLCALPSQPLAARRPAVSNSVSSHPQIPYCAVPHVPCCKTLLLDSTAPVLPALVQ